MCLVLVPIFTGQGHITEVLLAPKLTRHRGQPPRDFLKLPREVTGHWSLVTVSLGSHLSVSYEPPRCIARVSWVHLTNARLPRP